MAPTDDLNDWADSFAGRHGLVRAGFYFQDGMEIEQTEGALKALTRIPPRYANAFVDDPDVENWLADILKQAAEDSIGRAMPSVRSGPSLLILGATGTGKTHQAYGAIRGIAAFGVRSMWQGIAAADLYAKLRPRHGVDSEAEFRSIADAPLLIVDDLGAAKTSEWVEEVNYRLVNHRYESMLPTLFTSNVRPRELTEKLGERVASRLIEMTRRIALKGEDRRRAA